MFGTPSEEQVDVLGKIAARLNGSPNLEVI